jgi:hypothetical protein
MEPERTELTWSYEPADFFESPYERDYDGWRLSTADGNVVATITGNQLWETVEAKVAAAVGILFQLRAMQTGKQFRLTACAAVVEHRGGKQNIFIRMGVGSVVTVSDRLDVQLIDAATGGVISDTKAERIATEGAELAVLSDKAQQNPTLRKMVASFHAARNDPANALTHLYEIRDALGKHFGSEPATKSAVGISSPEWSTFGRLTCDEPLLEGRHRGKHLSDLRPATAEELSTVRDLAREWIRKFAATL